MENDTRSDHSTKTSQHAGDHPERFASQIKAEGYSHGSVATYSTTVGNLWSAMDAAKLDPTDLTDDRMDQLALPIINAASAKDQKHCRYRLNRFRDYLIENADAPARLPPPLDMTPRACLKR